MGRPVKFYTDEHVARAVVRGLRQRGADVLTVPEAGLLGASDEEHMERRGPQAGCFSPRMTTSCAFMRPASHTPGSSMRPREPRSATLSVG